MNSLLRKISLEECLKKFNITKSQFYAIKKVLDFDPFIKNSVLQIVGPIKSDILNKILELLLLKESSTSAQSKIKLYMNKSLTELKSLLTELENNPPKEKNIFEFKKKGCVTFFKINEILSDEDYLEIEAFIKKLLNR